MSDPINSVPPVSSLSASSSEPMGSASESIPNATVSRPITGHGIRACRGHWHVCLYDHGAEGEDLLIPGDPFKTREAALDAADRLNRRPDILAATGDPRLDMSDEDFYEAMQRELGESPERPDTTNSVSTSSSLGIGASERPEELDADLVKMWFRSLEAAAVSQDALGNKTIPRMLRALASALPSLIEKGHRYDLLAQAINADAGTCTPECSRLGHAADCKSCNAASIIENLQASLIEARRERDGWKARAAAFQDQRNNTQAQLTEARSRIVQLEADRDEQARQASSNWRLASQKDDEIARLRSSWDRAVKAVEVLPMRDVVTKRPDATRYEMHISRSAVLAILTAEKPE